MRSGTTPSATDEWRTLLSHAQARRLPAHTLGEFAVRLAARAPLPPARIAALLLSPPPGAADVDARVPLYAQALLEAGVLDVPAVLGGLLAGRGQGASDSDGDRSHSHSHSHVEAVLYGLARTVAGGERPRTGGEAGGVVRGLGGWMGVLVAEGRAEMMGMGGPGGEEGEGVRVAVGALLVAGTENERVQEALRGCPKGM